MQVLPTPAIVRCFIDRRFDPHLSALELRWDPDAPGVAERTWYFPDTVCLKGPAPERFGLTLHRRGDNDYQLRVLWNRLCLSWEHLPRSEIMASSLAGVLSALGTDLWSLINQPVETEPSCADAA